MIPIKCRIKKVLKIGYPLPDTYCKWRMSCKNRARCFGCENFCMSRYMGAKAAQGLKEGLEKISAAIPRLNDAFSNLAISLQEAIKNINNQINSIIKTYPNRRVVHLAKNHKSARVRKKNQKRIEKYFKKGA